MSRWLFQIHDGVTGSRRKDFSSLCLRDSAVNRLLTRRPMTITPQSMASDPLVTLADHLHSAAIHLLRRVRRQDTATGEGPARLSALSVLVFGGPKTLKELAAAEQVKPPTMSRIVAGLARSRLISITTDPGDSRRVIIRPTAKGIRLLHEGRRRRVSDLAAHLEQLTSTERADLARAVEILRTMLQQWM